MEQQDTNLYSNFHGQDQLASSSGNDLSSKTQHEHSASSSLPHGTKRKNSQSIEPNCELDPKRPNKADLTCSSDSEKLLRQLKQMQKECEEKSKQLNVYTEFIHLLQSNNAEKYALLDQLKLEVIEKDNRLAEFNNHSNATNEPQEKCNSNDAKLVGIENKVKQLEEEAVEKDTQLKTYADQLELYQIEISKLKAACSNSEKELSEKDRLFNELQAKHIKQNEQSGKDANIINNSQASSNDKKAQSSEKTNLVEQLQSQCVGTESQMQATPEELKNLEEEIANVNSCFQTVFNCAEVYRAHKQYKKAITYYENCITFEKSTQKRSAGLSELFVYKAFCYGALKDYQQVIEATSSALQYNSSYPMALYNRAVAYFKLKQYSNVCQDLETIFQLDSTYEEAENLLKQIQEHINMTSSSQV